MLIIFFQAQEGWAGWQTVYTKAISPHVRTIIFQPECIYLTSTYSKVIAWRQVSGILLKDNIYWTVQTKTFKQNYKEIFSIITENCWRLTTYVQYITYSLPFLLCSVLTQWYMTSLTRERKYLNLFFLLALYVSYVVDIKHGLFVCLFIRNESILLKLLIFLSLSEL